MVDSINNSGAHALLRAQQAATTALNNKPAPTTITQARNNAIVRVKPTSVPQTTVLAGASEKLLPRGSLVDRLV